MLVYCVEATVAHEVMTKKPKRKVGRVAWQNMAQ
jgi:hypothetical protein